MNCTCINMWYIAAVFDNQKHTGCIWLQQISTQSVWLIHIYTVATQSNNRKILCTLQSRKCVYDKQIRIGIVLTNKGLEALLPIWLHQRHNDPLGHLTPIHLFMLISLSFLSTSILLLVYLKCHWAPHALQSASLTTTIEVSDTTLFFYL